MAKPILVGSACTTALTTLQGNLHERDEDGESSCCCAVALDPGLTPHFVFPSFLASHPGSVVVKFVVVVVFIIFVGPSFSNNHTHYQVIMAPSLSQKLTAEFIAMTLFVFVGCGTAVASQVSCSTYLVGVSLFYGVTPPIRLSTRSPLTA